MAGSVNRAVLVGRLGGDPVIKTGSRDGKKFALFSVATGESWRDKNTGERREHTDWHNVVVFNEKLAEIAELYLKKGALVYVAGKMVTREYEGKAGQVQRVTEVVLPPFGGELSMMESKGTGRAPEPEDASQYGGRGFTEEDYRRASGG